jgi:hypothetical protein
MKGLLGLAKAALSIPGRRGFGGSDLFPSLPGLMP